MGRGADGVGEESGEQARMQVSFQIRQDFDVSVIIPYTYRQVHPDGDSDDGFKHDPFTASGD